MEHRPADIAVGLVIALGRKFVPFDSPSARATVLERFADAAPELDPQERDRVFAEASAVYNRALEVIPLHRRPILFGWRRYIERIVDSLGLDTPRLEDSDKARLVDEVVYWRFDR